jgi:hypothetical protein
MPDPWDTPDGQTHSEADMLDLEAIKARCEKATPGPWTTTRYPDEYHKLVPGLRNIPEPGLFEVDVKDAEFISHARTDLPACVAEIERLRAAYAALLCRWNI